MSSENHNQLSRAKFSMSQHLILLTFPFLTLLVILTLLAPHYLNYADQPARADAVVLFIGPGLEAREKEANKLLEAGYADYLIIPAYGRIHRKADQQTLSALSVIAVQNQNPGPVGRYPKFYENTHIEVLEAKRIMDHSGFKKANFVSSPSHMRRIKMITDHVFHQKNSNQDAYQIKFVAVRTDLFLPEASPWDLKYIGAIASEYIKMFWFYAYQLIS
jgi:uncharacterized SAM-binding protein YcdF (DUF218 family)